jgi:indole-3-glycerol phosphate synthase
MSEATPSVLERILRETREEVAQRKRDAPLDVGELPSGAGDAGTSTDEQRPLRDALRREGVGVIAEFKRRSPSAGALHDAPDLEQILDAYERGGAIAVSVLTEGPNFNGSLADLRAARGACGLPLLRKDFVVDRYQLHEALAAGADAVLLIVAALTVTELSLLYREARALGLDVLVEVHDREELEVALEIGADVIGVNNRNLRDFSVDVERTARLMEHMPAGVCVVSESGISAPEQLRALQALGVAGVLVGESLMRAGDPAAALRRLTTF